MPGKGVARRLITRLLENNDGIRFSLSAVPGVESLYASLGFVPGRLTITLTLDAAARGVAIREELDALLGG